MENCENAILDSLRRRRSVRAFTDEPVTAAEKAAILRAAVEAPTAGCQQLYTILDVTDPALKRRLSETCDHQPFIATAPLVLLFLADVERWYDAYLAAGLTPRKPGAGDLMLAVCDALIAAQNAVVAAESLGIGSCYIGDVMEQCETHRALLGLTDYVFPAALLVFGRPTPQQAAREKPARLPMNAVVRENGYRRASEAELREMFRGRTASQNYDEWMRAFCARKYDSDFSREMTRSVTRYLAPFLANGQGAERT